MLLARSLAYRRVRRAGHGERSDSVARETLALELTAEDSLDDDGTSSFKVDGQPVVVRVERA